MLVFGSDIPKQIDCWQIEVATFKPSLAGPKLRSPIKQSFRSVRRLPYGVYTSSPSIYDVKLALLIFNQYPASERLYSQGGMGTSTAGSPGVKTVSPSRPLRSAGTR
jgi:hypothetical protein